MSRQRRAVIASQVSGTAIPSHPVMPVVVSCRLTAVPLANRQAFVRPIPLGDQHVCLALDDRHRQRDSRRLHPPLTSEGVGEPAGPVHRFRELQQLARRLAGSWDRMGRAEGHPVD